MEDTVNFDFLQPWQHLSVPLFYTTEERLTFTFTLLAHKLFTTHLFWLCIYPLVYVNIRVVRRGLFIRFKPRAFHIKSQRDKYETRQVGSAPLWLMYQPLLVVMAEKKLQNGSFPGCYTWFHFDGKPMISYFETDL